MVLLYSEATVFSGFPVLREWSPPSMCPMSHVMCHNVSHVTCHMSLVTCRVSHAKILNFFSKKSGEASRLRVCYQRVLLV